MAALPDAQQAPMAPGRVPLLGHLPRVHTGLLEFLRKTQAKVGPVFWLDMGIGNRTLLVLDDDAFSLLRNKDTDSSSIAEFEALLGRSMFVVDGDDHRRMRNASAAAFTPAGLSRAKVGELIAETAARHVEGWRGQARVAVVRDCKHIALEVIFRMLDIAVDDLPAWSHWYGEFMLNVIRMPAFPGSPSWRGRRARRWLERELAKIIADVRARGERNSIVGAMVHGTDELGRGMNERELLDNLLVLGLAGHETTASTMAWSLLHLAHAPEDWQRLCDEANALTELPHEFTELAARTPYANAVFRESLRLYPPVNFDSRTAIVPFELAGYRIMPKTIVGASLLLLSRDPTRYPQPDVWRPARWLELDRKPTAIENCQFGGGPHFCLGYHMALLEGTMFLVHVARALSSWGVRPLPDGALPRARYLPVTQPPARSRIRLGSSA